MIVTYYTNSNPVKPVILSKKTLVSYKRCLWPRASSLIEDRNYVRMRT